MTGFNIFDKDFIDFCKGHDFKFNNNYQSANVDHNSFIVLTGKNGIGKSRLLQLIREYIVTIKNQNYPYMIVRRLDYGEHDDDYDPDKTDHPLVTENVLKCFGCDFDSWKILIEYLQKSNHSEDYQTFINGSKLNGLNTIWIEIVNQKKNHPTSPKPNSYENFLEFCKIFFKYYLSKIKVETDIQNSKKDETVIQNINRLMNNNITILDITEYEQKIYFDEFKKFYRRQILKKICYGSLKQMLMLNMRYQFDIDEINEFIRDSNSIYGLNFPYDIERINRGLVDKSDVNDRIIFKCDAKKVKFKDLSPGERLILHLIVLIKDRENIKMENIDKQIKQVLLLDEPDSHCENNLVAKLIQFINDELIYYIKIQVIMTSHNYLTISSKLLKGESLYLIKNDENNLDRLQIINDEKKSFSYEILAKNLTDIFDLFQHRAEVRAAAYKGVYKACGSQSVGGILLEDVIKELTKKKNKDLIKKLLNKNDLSKYEIEYDDKKWKDLEDCDFNFESETERDCLFIVWPTNSNNKAWDLMIYEKNISENGSNKLYFFQIKNSKRPFNKTMQKHCEIIIEKLDAYSEVTEFCDFKNSIFNYISTSTDKSYLKKIKKLLNKKPDQKIDKYKKFGGQTFKEIFDDMLKNKNNTRLIQEILKTINEPTTKSFKTIKVTDLKVTSHKDINKFFGAFKKRQ